MTRYAVVLEPVGGGGWTAPAVVRLRRALKHLLRSHGLRAVSVVAAGGKSAAEQTPLDLVEQNHLETLGTGAASCRREAAAALRDAGGGVTP